MIVDQPPPITTGRRPTWEVITAYVAQFQRADAPVALGFSGDLISLVLTDMRERDVVGRERYGTRLTPGNGRDHLIDAYQELLDGCAYLTNELEERGVSLTTVLTEKAFPDWTERWYLHDVQQLCVSQIRASIQLRALIKERDMRKAALR